MAAVSVSPSFLKSTAEASGGPCASSGTAPGGQERSGKAPEKLLTQNDREEGKP